MISQAFNTFNADGMERLPAQADPFLFSLSCDDQLMEFLEKLLHIVSWDRTISLILTELSALSLPRFSLQLT